MVATLPAPDRTGQYVLADVLRAEGFDRLYAVAGKPLTRTMEALAADGSLTWVNHEAVAVQLALGAAAAGAKTAALMKQVGMNCALDVIAISALKRSGGAMLLIVGDDPGSAYSATEGDARVLARYAELPCIEPAGGEDLAAAVADAVALSALTTTPVVLRATASLLMTREVEMRPRPPSPQPRLRPYDPEPAWSTNSLGQRKRLQAILRSLSEEGSVARRVGGEPRLRVIGSGEPAALAERTGDVDLLTIRRPVPAPRESIRAFLASGRDPVLVLEDGHPVLEELARELAPEGTEVWGRMSGHVPWAGIVDAPAIIDAAVGGQGIAEAPAAPRGVDPIIDLSGYGSLFEDIAALGLTPAATDAGMAAGAGALPGRPAPLAYGWGCTTGVAAGYADETGRPALAVAGDGGFFHSGVLGLMQAVWMQSPVITVILDDGSNGYTGRQPNPGSDPAPGQRALSIQEIAKGIGVDLVETIDHSDARSEVLRPMLERMMAARQPAVVVIRKR
jgi:indolepyruvate ferredoxin oxidoreductase alpha subunit